MWLIKCYIIWVTFILQLFQINGNKANGSFCILEIWWVDLISWFSRIKGKQSLLGYYLIQHQPLKLWEQNYNTRLGSSHRSDWIKSPRLRCEALCVHGQHKPLWLCRVDLDVTSPCRQLNICTVTAHNEWWFCTSRQMQKWPCIWLATQDSHVQSHPSPLLFKKTNL